MDKMKDDILLNDILIRNTTSINVAIDKLAKLEINQNRQFNKLKRDIKQLNTKLNNLNKKNIQTQNVDRDNDDVEQFDHSTSMFANESFELPKSKNNILQMKNMKTSTTSAPFGIGLLINGLQNAFKQKDEKSKNENIDSDDEYDDKFNVDDDEPLNETVNTTSLGDIKCIDDLIKIGEKFKEDVLKNEKEKEKEKEKESAIQIKNTDQLHSYYKLEGKQYVLNIKTICNLVVPLIKLNRMIGIHHVKKQLFDMIIFYLQGLENKNNHMLHSVIEGPSGVGKTKLGKILAQIYHALNIIPSNRFKYVKATDLIGEHVGATKHMTQSVIDEADGGILFIDEAYSLSTCGEKDPYGKECIDTLNYNLSENKKKLIVIIAGYPEQLEKYFFSHNQGLRRRFPFKYTIDKYTGNELAEIFKYKIKKFKWKLSISNDNLNNFFCENINYFPHFGGDIDNLFNKCQIVHSRRVVNMNLYHKKKINDVDLINGLELLKNVLPKDNDSWKTMFV